MKQPKFVLYRDSSKEWRWRFVSSNGNTLADSGEGYKRKIDMLKAIDDFLWSAVELRGLGRTK